MSYRDLNGVLRCNSYGRGQTPRVMTCVTTNGNMFAIVPVGYVPTFNLRTSRFKLLKSGEHRQ